MKSSSPNISNRDILLPKITAPIRGISGVHPSPPKANLLPSSSGTSLRQRVATVKEESEISNVVANNKSIVAVVMFQFDAEESDELSLKQGDIVEMLSGTDEGDGWCRVRNTNGDVGLAPLNFMEIQGH